MENSYIKGYVETLFNTIDSEFDQLKAIYYSLDLLINSLQFNLETSQDKYTYNRLTTCFLTIEKIIKEYEEEKGGK